MKPLTDNMRRTLVLIAAWIHLGRTSAEARYKVDGNAWGGLYRRGLFFKDEDGHVHDTDFLRPEGWAEVDMADVMDRVRRERDHLAEAAGNLQRKLEATQARLRKAHESIVNSGWDVVEVEVQLTPKPDEDVRPRKFKLMVLSPTDDKSQAFIDRATQEAKDRSTGYYHDQRVDFDAPAEYVQVLTRYTFGPVRRED